jgi:8-oxo-dGTP pyrophosphatase MutT (NUDIX family)/phosphohistidine phosphatase SixA
VAALISVRAAGGVVWRPAANPGDEPSVCLVHRPRRHDWSLPKGKLAPGEPPLVAAVREVREETAVRAVPQMRLPSIHYRVDQLVPKTVDYWSMRAVAEGEFTPNDEVDDLRWLPISAAEGLLTYPHDGRVLRAFRALPPVSATVALIRHAHAGERRRWLGADSARPLDAVGEREAGALAELLVVFAPDRLVSASPRRCLQTLAGLAERLDLPIEVEGAFDESPAARDGAAAADRLAALAASTGSTVVCAQGGAIPSALARLGGGGPARYETAKGAGWLLAFAGPDLAGIDRLGLS